MPDAEKETAESWEARYAGRERLWSGRPNEALVAALSGLEPGRALELGCGEGGDAIWLALRGWRVTAVDISATAVARAREAAARLGVPEDRIDWVVADLSDWAGEGGQDLVFASFLHGTATASRWTILQRACRLLPPGGRLLSIAHAQAPPWAAHEQDRLPGAAHAPAGDRGGHGNGGTAAGAVGGHGNGGTAAGAVGGHAHDGELFPTPEQEAAALAVPPDAWQLELAQLREREASGPDGERAVLYDSVVLLRRR